MLNEVLVALIAFFSIGGAAVIVSNYFAKRSEADTWIDEFNSWHCLIWKILNTSWANIYLAGSWRNIKTRKTPIKHRVKSYIRRGKVVNFKVDSYVRGKGSKSLRIAKPTVSIPMYWTVNNRNVEGIKDYVRGDEENLLHVAITTEDSSMLHNGEHEYEVHSWVSHYGDPDCEECHGGAKTRAEAEALARQVMEQLRE